MRQETCGLWRKQAWFSELAYPDLGNTSKVKEGKTGQDPGSRLAGRAEGVDSQGGWKASLRGQDMEPRETGHSDRRMSKEILAYRLDMPATQGEGGGRRESPQEVAHCDKSGFKSLHA